MRIIAFIEDYKVVKKILDYLGIDEFDEYIIDDYIDSDHVC